MVKFRIIIEKNGDVKQIKEPSLATKVKIYIDKNYNENISLKSIAEAVNANQYYLSHIFKEEIRNFLQCNMLLEEELEKHKIC